MPINNGDLIEASEINDVFSHLAGGLSSGLDTEKERNNGYSSIRFRQEQPIVNTNYKFRFTSPDDFDILTAGLLVKGRISFTPATDITVTARLAGVITDLENDLPVPDHLYLTEPVFNVDGKDLIELVMPTAAASEWTSSRYITYELNENRPCNTLLKGVTYDIDITHTGEQIGPPGSLWFIEFVICYKTKVRRN
jgi:hypothetical protein